MTTVAINVTLDIAYFKRCQNGSFMANCYVARIFELRPGERSNPKPFAA